MFIDFNKTFNLGKIILIFVISSIIFSHWIWFFNASSLTFGDWGFLHPNQIFDWSPLPNIWSVDNMGGMNPFFANSLIELPFRVLTNLFSFGIAERLTYLIPTILLSIFSIYKLCDLFGYSAIGKSVAIATYMGSTPLIITRTGHNTLAMAYSIAPLVIYYFTKSILSRKRKYILLTSIFGSIMCAYEPRAFYLLFLFLAFNLILIAVLDYKKTGFLSFLQKILVSFGILIITLLLMSYWILPLFLSGAGVTSEILGRPLFGADFSSMVRSLTLHHAFWNGGKYVPFVIQPIPIHFFIMPVLIIISFLRSNNKRLLPFKVLLIIGLFLSKQNNPPLGLLYEFFYSHLPGFSAFREASKFYFYITLSYSVLLGYFFDYIFNHNNKHEKLFVFKPILLKASLIVLMSTLLLNLKPLANGEIGTLFLPRNMPTDYTTLNDYLLLNSDNARVIGIPTTSRWIVRSDKFPTISYYTVFGSIPGASKLKNLGYVQQLVTFIESSEFKNYLNENSVRYIIVPLRDKVNDDDFYQYFNDDRTRFMDSISNAGYKKVNLRLKEVAIYENITYKERVTAASKDRQPTTNFKLINSTHYEVEVEGAGEFIDVVFRENFHPGWKLFLTKNKVNIFTYFFDRPIYTSHSSNLYKQNLFRFNLREMCASNFSLCRLTDTGYSLKFNIRFQPQIYVVAGYIISGLAFCSLVALLIVKKFSFKSAFRDTETVKME